MLEFFRTVLYQPLFNLFIFLVALMPNHNVGLAIIVLTVLTRMILLPLKKKSIESQLKQRELQPELKRLTTQYKDDRAGLSAAQMQLYKDKGINPASGCLPTLIQLPILIVLYYVFRSGLGTTDYHLLYPFVKAPETIQTSFLWFQDLTNQDKTMALPILAGVAQFFFSRSMMASLPASDDKNDVAAIMSKQMMYLAPIMTIVIARQFPAGLSLYWFVASLVDWGQQVYLTKRLQTQKTQQGKTRVTVRKKGDKS